MSNNENPIHAPVRGGRPLAGDEPRVSRSVSIDSRTNRAVDLNLARLRALEPHASPGHVIDRMAVFCAAFNFDVMNPEKRPKKTKKPAPVSTPAPAPATSGKA